MKKVVLPFLLLFAFVSTNGQYVLIPDSNFRHVLINKGYASCFDVSQTMLDTTCSNILDSITLDIVDSNIYSIDGIQYFKHLINFNCSQNNLTTIPALPNTLSQFICDNNSITSLSSLPPLLTNLEVEHNHIATLPPLPQSVKILFISDNNFTTLPTLPDSLLVLFCYTNHIDSFPVLPAYLNTLWCGGQFIQFFPALPSTLKTLDCPNVNLDSLPFLPDSLRYLNCSGNNLASLPNLPESLTYLDCSYNKLTSISALPDSLNLFSCSFNHQLKCLPELKRIVNFNYDSTNITCLPNYGKVTNSSPSLSTVPLCNAGNINGCAVATGIKNIASNSNLSIYPNPTNNKLEIELQNVASNSLQILIMDISGQVLSRRDINTTGSMEIDVSALPAGLYFLRVEGEGESWVKKFIKE